MAGSARLRWTLAAVGILGALAGCAPAAPSPQPFSTAAPTGMAAYAPDGTSVIFLVRHGRTVFNDKSLVQGWSDAPLTSQGGAQADAAGVALKDVVFSTVLTSDLGRARQTTNRILAENTAAIGTTELSALREANYGGFEGDHDTDFWIAVMESMGYRFDPDKSTDPSDFWSNPDAVAWYQATTDAERTDAIAQADPAGSAENWQAYTTRMQDALAQITQAAGAGPGNVLVVTHGGTIAQLLDLMDAAHYDPGVDLPNGSVSVVYYSGGSYQIQQIGVPTS